MLMTPILEARDPDALNIAICDSLPLFSPLSGGLYRDLAELTLVSARMTFPLLAHLTGVLGIARVTEFKQAEELCANGGPSASASAELLKQLFNKYGSDKSNEHDYHYVYGSLFTDAESVTSVLEIGLGTNNTTVPSNMGESGKPGASLRAFRDYFSNANIYGADVDKQILFEENRIKTFFVNQLSQQTLDDLGTITEDSFDLIIDDGLHQPSANIAVLAFGIGKLKPQGCLVIEDIKSESVPVWEVVSALLPAKYYPYLVTDKFGSIAFVVKNTSTDCHSRNKNGQSE